jgi:hypothetical protein
MDNRIGQYHYFDGFMKEKVFGDRIFKVVIAAAYNAGIIGPEHNGIAVLDDNNKAVLLDQHVKIGSGYFGPSEEQKAEFARIVAMDWNEFADFVRSNRRYRKGVADDIDNPGAKPSEIDPLDLAITKGKVENPTGPDIRTPKMIALHADDKSGYAFPDKTREEMIVTLARHDGRAPMNSWNGGFALGWNIKVRGRVDGNVEGYGHDPRFDAKWDKYIDEDGGELFNEACESALRQYLDDGVMSAADESSIAKFYTNGRSGGHLVLSSWSGSGRKGWSSCQMAFDSREDYIGWLKDLSDDDLVSFYGLVQTVDADTSDPTAIINHEFAFMRQNMEEQWAAELAPAV